MAQVGVLALQGDYHAHAQVLRTLGHVPVEVRGAAQLAGLDGLVLPGGESTTQLKMLARDGMEPALRTLLASGKPVLATCAGLILLARKVRAPEQPSLGVLDVTVRRNAYGRQLDSFEAISDGGLPLLFIRAPRIVEMGVGVEVLDRLDGDPILVRQGAIVAASFHPELSDSLEVHRRHFGAADELAA